MLRWQDDRPGLAELVPGASAWRTDQARGQVGGHLVALQPGLVRWLSRINSSLSSSPFGATSASFQTFLRTILGSTDFTISYLALALLIWPLKSDSLYISLQAGLSLSTTYSASPGSSRERLATVMPKKLDLEPSKAWPFTSSQVSPSVRQCC